MGTKQQEYVEALEALNNRELFYAFIDAQVPDDWDGGFTPRGQWRAEQAEEILMERLADWLEEKGVNNG